MYESKYLNSYYNTISIYEFYKKYLIKENINIIDLRPKDKFELFHIEKSINIPFSEISKFSFASLDNNKIYYLIDYNNEYYPEANIYFKENNINSIFVFGGIKRWRGAFN